MSRVARRMLPGLALLVAAACSSDPGGPTEKRPTDADAERALLDPAIGAEAGQASLPGLTMDRAATFLGADERTGGGGDRSPCVFSAATGRFTCPPVVRGGLTTTRSYAIYDAAGTPQQKRDSTTRSTNTQVSVTGTTTTGRGTVTVERSSSLTTSGLGRNATTHSLNGSETGRSTGTFTSERGTHTVTETFSVSTVSVVVPVQRAQSSWPLSGTTTRTHSATRTGPDGVARTSSGSERVTYTGTSVVNVTIVRDGVTRNCTRDLAARTTTCS